MQLILPESCDSLLLTVKAIAGVQSINDSLGLVLGYENADGSTNSEDILAFASGRLQIKRGINTIATCPINSVSKFATGARKVLTFDMNSCLVNSGIVLTNGDSTIFQGRFTVKENGPYSVQFRRIPNLRSFFYAERNGAQISCDDFGDIFTVAKQNTVFSIPSTTDFPKGCNEATLDYRLLTINNGYTDFFGSETRASVKVDSFVLDYDPRFATSFDDFQVWMRSGNHPIFGNQFFQLNNVRVLPNGKLSVILDTLTQVPSIANAQSNPFTIRLRFKPNCGTNINSTGFSLNPKIVFKDRFYASSNGNNACVEQVTSRNSQNIFYSESPEINLTNVGNDIIRTPNTNVQWVVRQCNNSTESDITASWLSVENRTTGISISSIRDITNITNPINLPITRFGAGNSKAFVFTNDLRAANGLNPVTQVCKVYEINALKLNCDAQEVEVKTSWSCSPYSTGFNPDQASNCQIARRTLGVSAFDGNLDANVLSQPSSSFDFCKTVEMEFIVRNTGLGKVFGLDNNIFIPSGATLVPGSVQIAYPSSSAYENANSNPVLIGNTPRGQQYAYANISNLNTNLSNNGLNAFNPTNPNDSNQYKIKFRFETGCNFESGSLVYYSVVGNNICNQPTNLELGESFPININGAIQSGSKLFDVAIQGNPMVALEDTSSIFISVKNLTSSLTAAGDFVFVKLPVGVSYSPNSATNLIEPVIDVQNGMQILRWPIQPGLALNEIDDFGFDIRTQGVPCSTTQLEFSLSTQYLLSVPCSSSPIPCNVNVITTANGTRFITLNTSGSGAGVNFVLTNLTSQCLPDKEAVAFAGNLNGISGATIQIKIFADRNNNNILDQGEILFGTDRTIGQNGTADVSFGFELNPSDACKLKLQLEGPSSCGSGIQIISLSAPKLFDAGFDQNLCRIEGGVIQTSLGVVGCNNPDYTFTWRAISPAQESWISNINIINPSLNIPTSGVDINGETFRFVLATQRAGCTDLDFDTILVKVLPKINIDLADSVDVVLGSNVTLNPIVTGTSGLITYEWNPNIEINDVSIRNPTITPTSTRYYRLFVRDGNGCFNTDSIKVKVINNSNELVGTISPEVSSICVNDSINLVAGGGTDYSWFADVNNPSGTTISGTSTNTIKVVSTGTAGVYNFFAIVTDPAKPGQIDTVKAIVNVLSPPQLTVLAIPSDSICPGQGVQLSVSPILQGSIYSWTNAGNVIGDTRVITVTPNITTAYSVQVNGVCVVKLDYTVNVKEGISVSLGPDATVCLGDSLQLNASVSRSFANAIWSPRVGLSNISGVSATAKPLVNTVYSLEIVASNGCRGIDSILLIARDCSADTCNFFRDDSTALQTVRCGENGTYVLEIALEDIDKYIVLVNGDPTTQFSRETKTLGRYFYGPVGNGPYQIDPWPFNGLDYKFNVTSFDALLDSMRRIDPAGLWRIDKTSRYLIGGKPTNTYGTMKIIEGNTVNDLFFARDTVIRGTGIVLPPGYNQVIIERKDASSCKDTIVVRVLCTKPDTMNVTVFQGECDTVCVSTTELSGPAVNLFNTCASNGNANITSLFPPSPCFRYCGVTPGLDRICAVVCDADGVCDTTLINIRVIPKGKLDLIDTIFIFRDTITYCFDTTRVGGPIDTIINICAANNSEVVSTIDHVTGCVTYTGIAYGTDTLCMVIIGVNGRRDTVNIRVTVIPPRPEIIIQNYAIGQSRTYCFNTNELKPPFTSFSNICPDKAGENVMYMLNQATKCIEVTGLLPGRDTICMVLCTEHRGITVCDTTIYIAVILEINPNDLPILVDDRDTVKAGGGSVNIKILDNDFIPGTLSTIRIIRAPIFGTAILNPLDNSLDYTGFSNVCDQMDTLSYEVCNSTGCDNALVLIWVKCPQLTIFNAVSPNGDGRNETFYISNLDEFPKHELIIYNRWGNQVLKTKNYQNDWRGIWEGQDLPDGTYFYVLELNDASGKRFNGYINLKR
jgi:gliding motility-associated-like protein